MAPVAQPATHVKGSVVNEITERRAKAGKLQAGIAAASTSDMFKGSVSLLVYVPDRVFTNLIRSKKESQRQSVGIVSFTYTQRCLTTD
jgi:uncharacterized protein (DUF2384 family)